jgi:hypothetical protein
VPRTHPRRVVLIISLPRELGARRSVAGAVANIEEALQCAEGDFAVRRACVCRCWLLAVSLRGWQRRPRSSRGSPDITLDGLAHRMRNLAVKVPADQWPEFKARVTACYRAPSRAIARDLRAGICRELADCREVLQRRLRSLHRASTPAGRTSSRNSYDESD